MIPTVLRASVAANPDVVTLIDKLEVEGHLVFVSVVLDPGCTVFLITVLNKNSSLVILASLSSLAKDVESGEDIAIIGRHLHRLPIIAHLGHDIAESRVVDVIDLLNSLCSECWVG